MESLSDTQWDVVISGTGLQQSLLALALSRSGKNILHVDPNDYYGGPEAALSLPEADEWAERHRADSREDALFSGAEVKQQADELASRRAYTLALAPQLIHSRSKLVSQLVDSKAFRHIEFLAVGSFFIYQPPSDSSAPSLSRIPSTREDVFSNTAIPVRSKRSLMKFLKFVLDFDSEPQTDMWHPHADEPLDSFLASTFKLDTALQSYIITLTLSHNGKISVKDGLTTIHRHLTSMGAFGPGFAAVYPKWGGLSEVAQVGCRAAAVGGAVYMLGTGIKDVRKAPSQDDQTEAKLELELTNDMVVKTKRLIQGSEQPTTEGSRISRLTAITKSDFSSLFELLAEGAPVPAVAVVAFPVGSVSSEDGKPSEYPVYAMVHSSDTGECPSGQYAIYLTTVHDASSKSTLQKALSSLVATVQGGDQASQSSPCIYQLFYNQCRSASSLVVDGNTATFPLPPVDLAFNDSVLDPVQEAWKMVLGGSNEEDVEYMKFEDREGGDEDDAYD
ncbi:GDP dissociation inhibitor [Ilyonectria robusta]|uniref:GDP dissociation inhibitor n=1 Tax=Ilyonectria robusta TaxID=1079257 RepID=UPI001E8CAE45|nr:GDP dissociation inhibitor [Ilyonectria robusta]KAH8677170.1 GDP dissociation inhibitor [Ilyonectria robusta]